MSHTTVSSHTGTGQTWPTSWGAFGTLGIYCDQDFVDDLGHSWQLGTGESLTGEFVTKVAITVSGGVPTYDSFVLPKTDATGMVSPNVVRYFGVIFDSKGAPRDFLFENYFVRTSLGDAVSYLALANDNAQRPFRPQVDTKPNTDQMNTAINAIAYAPASTTQLGLVEVDVNPFDSALPEAVGSNSPRVTHRYYVGVYTSLSAAIDAIGGVEATLVIASESLIGTKTIPANVILEFTNSGRLLLTTGQTTTILSDGKNWPTKKIFYNAVSGQGTISFSGNKSVTFAHSEWWGAVGDNSTNDKPALQAAIAALDSGSGGTLILNKANYRITSTLFVGSTSSQNYINLQGQGPVTSIITYAGATNSVALSISNEAYVSLNGFRVNNAVARGTTRGIEGTGTGADGTNSFNSIVQRVIIDGFNIGWRTSNGTATSSEFTFINLTIQNCNTGFLNDSFNGLDFSFINVGLAFCTIGMDLETAGVHVLSGSGSANATVFKIVNGGNYSIEHFEDEESTGLFLDASGTDPTAVVTVRDCNIGNGSLNPNSRTALSLSGGQYIIENNLIHGQVTINGNSAGLLRLNNNSIVDPNNTFTSTANPVLMGPGFRITGGTFGQPFYSWGNRQYDTNFGTFIGFWPSGDGYLDLAPGGIVRAVLREGKGSDIASGFAALDAPSGAIFHVTGTTNFSSITSTHVPAGMVITIIFDGILVVGDANNLKLAGPFTTSAGSSLSLRYDGTSWFEIARSVN